jgi:hypothetical protein
VITAAKPRCLRSNGTERAWFLTREQAIAFAQDQANPAYHGDIAHLCSKCDMYHLSRPEWLEPQFTPTDAQILEDMGIEAAQKFADFKCSICGAPMREGIYYLIMPDGSIRCETPCGPELAR